MEVNEGRYVAQLGDDLLGAERAAAAPIKLTDLQIGLPGDVSFGLQWTSALVVAGAAGPTGHC
jgi:hypothetical protein